MNTKTLLSMHLTASEVDSVRESFSRFCHTPVDLKVWKSWTLWKINLQKCNNFCCYLHSRCCIWVSKMSRHFFFVLPSKRRKQRSEKNTRVCSTPHLMESCWKVHFEVLFGARGGFIFCSFFLFHDRKSGSFSPTEKRFRAPRRIALLLLSPTRRDVCNNARKCTSSALNSTVSTSVRSVYTLRKAYVSHAQLGDSSPLSKQSFTLTAKPESPLLMLLLIVMGRS